MIEFSRPLTYDLSVVTLKMKYLYVEPTTKCRLACSRCVRTYLRSSYRVQELDVDLLLERLEPFESHLEKIELGGNYGDPIYHSQFLEIVRRLKTPQRQIIVHTNGSHRAKEFWQELGSILDSRDRILFSVDGLKDTNAMYRRGSDWDSLEVAFAALRTSSAHKIWKFIVFSHNQHQLERLQDVARGYGFQKVMVIKSSLFGQPWSESLAKDPLAPSKEWMSVSEAISGAQFRPQCQSSSRHFISASGHYFPCCWMGHTHNYRNTFIETALDQLDLRTHTVQEILASPILAQLQQSFQNGPLPICQKTCTAVQTEASRSIHQNLIYDLGLDSGSGSGSGLAQDAERALHSQSGAPF